MKNKYEGNVTNSTHYKNSSLEKEEEQKSWNKIVRERIRKYCIVFCLVWRKTYLLTMGACQYLLGDEQGCWGKDQQSRVL